jgi:hypothetical protein
MRIMREGRMGGEEAIWQRTMDSWRMDALKVE